MKATIKSYMTPAAHTIGSRRSLADAHRLMREYQIRHLPVLEAGKLVGMVTERDLHLLETLKDINQEEVTVEEAMSQDVYAVPPDAPLEEVARTMAERRYGSAVVLEGQRALGIFTTTDALRALAELTHGKSAARKTPAPSRIHRPQ